MDLGARALIRWIALLATGLLALVLGGGLAAGSPPVTLKEAVDLRLAVDASGRAVAAWGQELEGYVFRLKVAERGATGWAPARILTPPGESISGLDLAGNAAGDVVAAWQRDPSKGAPIRAIARTAAGVWGDPVDLAPAGTIAKRPRVGVGDDGTAVVAWDGPDGAVAAAVRRPGEAWGPMRIVSGPGTIASGLAAPAVAADGSALLAWTATNAVVTVAELPAGPAGVFGDPHPLTAPEDVRGGPAVALGPDGTAVAAWRRGVGDGTGEIVVAARGAGGDWDAPAALAAASPDPPPAAYADRATPAIVIDATGRAVALWVGAASALQAVVRPPGGGWGAARTLGQATDARRPMLVAGAGGTVLAGWMAGSASAAIAAPGAELAPAEDLTPPGFEDLRRLQIGLDGTGGMVAVWGSRPGFATPTVTAAARTAGGLWGAAGIISVALGPRGPVPGEPDPEAQPPTTTDPDATPRPPRGNPRPGRVKLSEGQLRINQRIAQAALRRARALEARLAGRPVPRRPRSERGTVRLTRAQLAVNQRISQTALRRIARLEARIEGRTPPRRPEAGQGRIALTAGQLLIDQRIAQAALRRIAALEEALADR
ncbi:MAG: hypothetical protein QOD86_3076 [Miltoncostaeaceae bacterium]|jgi:hypothetical protein|nr:hypothetical protein [Miltoncostaeaceae bacterium]